MYSLCSLLTPILALYYLNAKRILPTYAEQNLTFQMLPLGGETYQ